MSKTIHGTKTCLTLRLSAWWFKHQWHKRYRVQARALVRQAELGGDVALHAGPQAEMLDRIVRKGDEAAAVDRAEEMVVFLHLRVGPDMVTAR